MVFPGGQTHHNSTLEELDCFPTSYIFLFGDLNWRSLFIASHFVRILYEMSIYP